LLYEGALAILIVLEVAKLRRDSPSLYFGVASAGIFRRTQEVSKDKVVVPQPPSQRNDAEVEATDRALLEHPSARTASVLAESFVSRRAQGAHSVPEQRLRYGADQDVNDRLGGESGDGRTADVFYRAAV
jgi:hypothetical protein